jgi:hypothetical protein
VRTLARTTHSWIALALAIAILPACGASTTSNSSSPASQSPSASPSAKSYKAQDVIDLWTKAGLLVSAVMPCDPPLANSPIPRTWTDDVCFTIASIAPHGGQVMTFDTETNERAIVSYFQLFPSLAPYVYVHANVVAQLNSSLTAADAKKFDDAMSPLGPRPASMPPA